jgi:hypothetical protein
MNKTLGLLAAAIILVPGLALAQATAPTANAAPQNPAETAREQILNDRSQIKGEPTARTCWRPGCR